MTTKGMAWHKNGVFDLTKEITWEADGNFIVKGRPLTNKELDVLIHIANGLSNYQIAKELGMSEQTLKNHVYHIFRKLGAQNRIEAINAGYKMGYIGSEDREKCPHCELYKKKLASIAEALIL